MTAAGRRIGTYRVGSVWGMSSTDRETDHGRVPTPQNASTGEAASTETDASTITDADRRHLRRCVDLAREGVDAGDEAFGSILVDGNGAVLFEDRNRVVELSDPTRHPEFEITRWAVEHLSVAERARAVVYTSGEHCAMCSAAHAWVGLGRIVYATSTEQLTAWHAEWGTEAGPVEPLPIGAVAPQIEVCGPAAEFADEVRALHERALGLTR